MIFTRESLFILIAISSFQLYAMNATENDVVTSVGEFVATLESQEKAQAAAINARKEAIEQEQVEPIHKRKSKRVLESTSSQQDESCQESESESEKASTNLPIPKSLRWVCKCINRVAKPGEIFTKSECNSIAKRSIPTLNDAFSQLVKLKVVEKVGSQGYKFKNRIFLDDKSEEVLPRKAARNTRKLVTKKPRVACSKATKENEIESGSSSNEEESQDEITRNTLAFLGVERIFEIRKIRPTDSQKKILKAAILHRNLSVDMRGLKKEESSIHDLVLLGFIQERSSEDTDRKSKYKLALPPVLPPTLD